MSIHKGKEDVLTIIMSTDTRVYVVRSGATSMKRSCDKNKLTHKMRHFKFIYRLITLCSRLVNAVSEWCGRIMPLETGKVPSRNE